MCFLQTPVSNRALSERQKEKEERRKEEKNYGDMKKSHDVTCCRSMPVLKLSCTVEKGWDEGNALYLRD